MLLTLKQDRLDASVTVLGMFDGVHRGHQALLIRGRELADRLGLPLAVYTFEPHPLAVLRPDHQPPRLTTLAERAGMMADMGVDVFRVDRFTKKVAAQSPEDFLRGLMEQLHPVAVVAGFNYSFGERGRGRADLLQAMGGQMGYEASIVPEVVLDGDTVSSTRIRRLIEGGSMQEAARLLGRAYAVTGVPEGSGSHCTLQMDPGKVRPCAGNYSGWLLRGGAYRPVQINVNADGLLALTVTEGALPAGGRARVMFYQ